MIFLPVEVISGSLENHHQDERLGQCFSKGKQMLEGIYKHLNIPVTKFKSYYIGPHPKNTFSSREKMLDLNRNILNFGCNKDRQNSADTLCALPFCSTINTPI